MYRNVNIFNCNKYLIYVNVDNTNPMSNANGAQGGSDFSAQWIQYYRSMGMHREAEFIEQQAKQMKVCTHYLLTFRLFVL